jgi:UPF0755 protein
MLKGDNLKKAIFWVAGLFITCFAYYVWQIFTTPNFDTKEQDTFVLYIPSNSAKYETVLDSLKKNKIVRDETSFRFLSKILKYPQHVKAGRYVIKKSMGNYALINKLKEGNQDPVKLTFNNVRLKEDLIKKIGHKFEFDSTALVKMLDDTSLCAKYGFNSETMMCMFLPNTYDVFWSTTPEKLLDRMQAEYKRFWNDDRLAKAKAIGMSPTEVQILASIVEEETKKNDEKPRVAGLYMNRLNTQMPLQADPTIKFALKDFGIKRILNNQLSVNSPYNTYRNLGLPPGPIRLADLTSIDAVLSYERHNYTYMCASPEFNGYHIFTDSYADHLNNARLYQDALNKRNIMK